MGVTRGRRNGRNVPLQPEPEAKYVDQPMAGTSSTVTRRCVLRHQGHQCSYAALSLAPSDAHQVLIHQLLRTSRSSRCLRSTETTCPTIITVVMPTPTQCTALAMVPLRLLYALKRRSQTRPSSSDSSTVLHRPFVVTMNETQTRPRCTSSKRGQWHSRRCSPHNRTRHLHPRHRAAAP